jgi:hypothetical protein
MKNKIQSLFISASLVFVSLFTMIPANVLAQDKSTTNETSPAATSTPPAATPTPSAATPTPQTEPIDKVVININQRRLPRVCVPSPLLKMVETSHSLNTSEVIRNVLIQYMSGPMIEVVALDSRIPVHIEAEARIKTCDLVLYSTMTLRKTGGTSRLGSFLKKVAPAAALIALTGGAGLLMAATAARVSTEVVGEVTADRKKKDKITFEYKLVKVGGALPVVANVVEDRAKEDSEDVLTPMLAENAEIVVIAALRYYAELLAPPKERNQEKENIQTPAQDNAQQVAISKTGPQAAPAQKDGLQIAAQNGGGQ